jgi:hypothetical protein
MKIQSYPEDNNISLQDKVTGTDADDGKKTKNYTFQAIKDFFIAQGFGGGSSGASAETTPSYKVYTALLSQSETNAPVAIVLENTLGGTVVWSYTETGAYFGVLTNAFKFDKTCFIATLGFINVPTQFGTIAVARTSNNAIRLKTTDVIGILSDNVLDKATIEIRVYN